MIVKKWEKYYFNLVIDRIEKLTDQEIKSKIIFYESFCLNDFIKEYNSYKGNAYGLANTLFQTAIFKPKRLHTSSAHLLLPINILPMASKKG